MFSWEEGGIPHACRQAHVLKLVNGRIPRTPSSAGPVAGGASRRDRGLGTGHAARLKRLLIKKWGRNLRAGQADRWTRTWFHDQGLYKLMGIIVTPRLRNHVTKTVGEPYAGKSHVQIERGMGNRAQLGTAPLTTNGHGTQRTRP